MPSPVSSHNLRNLRTAFALSTEHDGEDVEAQGLSQEQTQSTDDGTTVVTTTNTKIERLHSLKYRTKKKTRKLLSINDAKSADIVLEGGGDIMKDITSDPAFNPRAIQSQQKGNTRERAKATVGSIGSFATSLANPKDAIKAKAARIMAGKLSKAQRPYLSRDADAEFLEVHDDLCRAESSRSSGQATSDEDQDISITGHKDRIREMETHRESLRVQYIVSRHVTRVRVVPKRHLDFPNRDAFFKCRGEGEPPSKYDWLKWIGYVLVWYTQDFSAQYIDDFDELPYDIDSVRRHIERIVLVRFVFSGQ